MDGSSSLLLQARVTRVWDSDALGPGGWGGAGWSPPAVSCLIQVPGCAARRSATPSATCCEEGPHTWPQAVEASVPSSHGSESPTPAPGEGLSKLDFSWPQAPADGCLGPSSRQFPPQPECCGTCSALCSVPTSRDRCALGSAINVPCTMAAFRLPE